MAWWIYGYNLYLTAPGPNTGGIRLRTYSKSNRYSTWGSLHDFMTPRYTDYVVSKMAPVRPMTKDRSGLNHNDICGVCCVQNLLPGRSLNVKLNSLGPDRLPLRDGFSSTMLWFLHPDGSKGQQPGQSLNGNTYLDIPVKIELLL